jgi:alpha-L-rhamnosidase
MKKVFFALVLAMLSVSADELDKVFQNPPVRTEPYMYWYWLNNNVSAKGITADLEAMKQAGIGEVFIGHIVSEGIPEGKVAILSPEWWDLVCFAVKEGDRIGVRVGMFNGPGWSQSGGPWMKPEESMRYLVSKETRICGGASFNERLDKNEKAIQDVGVIAYPVPKQEGRIVRPARVECSAEIKGLAPLLSGKAQEKRGCALPKKPFTLDLFFDLPTTFQTLVMEWGASSVKLEGKLEAIVNGQPQLIRDLKIFRTNLMPAMGPLVAAPFTFSFEPTEVTHLRITISQLTGSPVLEDLVFSSVAHVDFGVEKQLGRMYPEPVPPPDAFLWPRMPEVLEGSAVDVKRIVTLTSLMDQEGRLTWKAPEGSDWVISRIGMASTGVTCSPTPPQATGLECDKMSRAAVEKHFDAMMGEFLRRIPKEERKGFQHITLDSYEVGPQNWTDDMATIFTQKYGYDPMPWLACLKGQVVGSRDQTDRFLWDWRRLVADLIAINYVGGLKAVANRHGLIPWLENYGHWGFPGESLQYGGQSDDIGGEYWYGGTLGDIECRLATSCGNTYGKDRVSAEAFTSGRNFVQTPARIKTRGDWCFTEGVNHFVLHLYSHQPYDVAPGLVPWFGADFNRFSTWFKDYGKGWTDYLKRSCALLQQGSRKADIAYFFGEDAPKMNGLLEPARPKGYDFDFINKDILLRSTCRDGYLTLPYGARYRVLVLPPCETMTPDLAEHLEELVKKGLVLVGNPFLRSPSLQNYPSADAQVSKAAQALWGDDLQAKTLDRVVRKGHVFRGHTLEQVFQKINEVPDFACTQANLLYTHRTGEDFDLYFISNQLDSPISILPEFRVTGRQPEVWDASTGTKVETAQFECLDRSTRVPLKLPAAGSIFVVFRKSLVQDINSFSLLRTVGLTGTAETKPVQRAQVLTLQGPDSNAEVFFDVDGILTLCASKTGSYQAKRADGTLQVWTVPQERTPLVLDTSSWQVLFKPAYTGTPFELAFSGLTDWSKHGDDRVRYFSGTAVYQTTFEWPGLASGKRMTLSLGRVAVIASLKVNGIDCGVLWKEPFSADITAALKEGENRVEISVANTWHNRLIGDEQFPDDTGALPNGLLKGWPEWMTQNQPRPEPRRTTLLTNKQDDASKKSPLQSSGLLGPVTVSEASIVK